ncbi:MAG TPA: hypothetical protein VGA53_01395 [Candidatus Paceibacterota bacterium]
MNTPRKEERIPANWFYNIKRRSLFAGLRREGWQQHMGGNHYRFAKQGYGNLIFPFGSKSTLNNHLTPQHFRKAGISKEEAARILGRKPTPAKSAGRKTTRPRKKPP